MWFMEFQESQEFQEINVKPHDYVLHTGQKKIILRSQLYHYLTASHIGIYIIFI